ncbi:outer membrane protein assembly factor BamD [Acidicapsa dinghuensis]|uniref:Outer membrane protein assembly factor BamD n=1 Tax=Acidicapsa dinghuensis TaxID=2218256 RepID=A0ABW1EF41_9BACT|nr:outer membrane protein assembly factor BamD [Acidicapsa dinghuensis]
MSLFTCTMPGRTLRIVSTASILAIALSVIPANAKEKPKKHKKNEDLSANPLADVNSKQPDKQLYDKAMLALKKGRFDVARLDLQTLLNTYPQSEYQMRAKLAVGDAWFKEGGTAALAQAEAEYEDFITFFPTAPEAAEAKMKVGDIYFMQMEKPDRDYTNAEKAEQKYREMIQQFPDSSLIPRAKQRLREVQEVLAEREYQIGAYYSSRLNWPGSIARLQTVADTYPLYSRSDQVWLTIGDDYAGEAKQVQLAKGLPAAVRERLQQVYYDKAAAAYAKVVTRYPMAPMVEDARDRLIAMNRPIPEPTQAAIAESEAEEQSRQPVRFTDKALGMVKHGPVVVEAAHVGEPTMTSPTRTTAPEITKENQQIFLAAYKTSQPGSASSTTEAAGAAKPTSPNEPPRSDQPQAPLQFEKVGGSEDSGSGGNSVGVSIVSAPNSAADASKDANKPAEDPNAVVKSVGTTQTTLPAAEAPSAAPDQVNDIKSGSNPQPAAQTADANGKSAKAKKPKLDESEDASSKKKKKKGLSKLNPF